MPTDTPTVTEREKILAQREAYMEGWRDGDDHYRADKARAAARRLYPLPPREEPNVKESDDRGMFWWIPPGERLPRGSAVDPRPTCSWHAGMPIDYWALTPQRITWWAELIAQPTVSRTDEEDEQP